jgi:hypothetical protein
LIHTGKILFCRTWNYSISKISIDNDCISSGSVCNLAIVDSFSSD